MKPWMVIACAGLLAAGIVAAAVVLRPEPNMARLQRDFNNSREEIRGLRDELAKLSKPAPAPPAAAPETEALRLRLAALEAEVKKLREEKEAAAAAKSLAVVPLAPAEPSARDPQEIARLQSVAADPSKLPYERVQALLGLRMSEIGGQPGGRSREVVAAMVQLLEASDDPKIRADICRHLHRAVPPEFKDPLMRRMQLDAEAKVREEAAETLGPLKGDPSVKAALEHAAQNDPDLKVRAQALQSLSDRR
jgi:hypothetical protein